MSVNLLISRRIKRDPHLIFQTPSSGQSSEGKSSTSAREFTAVLALTSNVSGITATIRGAPSTPLNTRVADTRALRFASWICFELFLRFRRVCDAELEDGDDFGDARAILPI